MSQKKLFFSYKKTQGRFCLNAKAFEDISKNAYQLFFLTE